MNKSHGPLSLAQKLEIGRQVEAGESDRRIAQVLGVSRWVVRKWRRRLRSAGRVGLSIRRGRPKRGVLSTFPAELSDQLLQWRQAHPGWGPTSLLARLGQDEYWGEQDLPDRSQIGRFLHEMGLTRQYQPRSSLVVVDRPHPQRPHQEWELDAQAAQQVPGLGWVILLNIIDVCSTMKIVSQAVLVSSRQSKAKTEDHQLALRRAFLRAGLPGRLAVDHDSVYYDRSPSPFPTRLHLWLKALGVELVFGRFGQPTDQAHVERMHQTMTAQTVEGGAFPSLTSLQSQLDQDLDFINNYLPCRSLANQAPLQAYPQAAVPRRWYRPEAEIHLLDVERVYDYLTQGHWFRLVSAPGGVSLGDQRYKVGPTWAKQQVELVFQRPANQFVIKTAAGGVIRSLTPKGLTALDLMGEAGPAFTLPTFQLALPFSPADWRRLQLLQLQAGTNLCDSTSGTI